MRKSAYLEDLNSTQSKDRYYLNDCVLFLERIDYAEQTQQWKFIAKTNDQVRKNVQSWTKPRTAKKNWDMYLRDKDSIEEDEDVDN